MRLEASLGWRPGRPGLYDRPVFGGLALRHGVVSGTSERLYTEAQGHGVLCFVLGDGLGFFTTKTLRHKGLTVWIQ